MQHCVISTGGVPNENVTVDSEADGNISDEEEEEEELEEGIMDEGFVDYELRRNNDTEGNADQMQSLFMHLKETMMLDVCYNCTLGRTKITYFRVCCEELYSEFICDEIFAFVCELMGVRGKVDETENCAIPGYHMEEVIKAALLRFFREFVMCQKCGHKMKRAEWIFNSYVLKVACPNCSFRREIKVTPPEVEYRLLSITFSCCILGYTSVGGLLEDRSRVTGGSVENKMWSSVQFVTIGAVTVAVFFVVYR